jgi:hypothetical protein
MLLIVDVLWTMLWERNLLESPSCVPDNHRASSPSRRVSPPGHRSGMFPEWWYFRARPPARGTPASGDSYAETPSASRWTPDRCDPHLALSHAATRVWQWPRSRRRSSPSSSRARSSVFAGWRISGSSRQTSRAGCSDRPTFTLFVSWMRSKRLAFRSRTSPGAWQRESSPFLWSSSLPEPMGREATYERIGAALGRSPDLLLRLSSELGLPPSVDDRVRSEDADMLALIRIRTA